MKTELSGWPSPSPNDAVCSGGARKAPSHPLEQTGGFAKLKDICPHWPLSALLPFVPTAPFKIGLWQECTISIQVWFSSPDLFSSCIPWSLQKLQSWEEHYDYQTCPQQAVGTEAVLILKASLHRCHPQAVCRADKHIQWLFPITTNRRRTI